MFLIVPVPSDVIEANARAFRDALTQCGYKLEYAAHLMGEMTREQLGQWLRGVGAFDQNRVLMLTQSPDGRVLYDLYLAALAEINGTEHLDSVTRKLDEVVLLIKTRMAKALLRDAADERRTA